MSVEPPNSTDSIVVCVRARPLNASELANPEESVSPWTFTEDSAIDKEFGNGPKTYTYDRVFGSTSTNAEVYDQCAKRVVSSALQGYNGTVFAYGQTGSGKTHSMLGTPRDPGIVPRAVHDIFKHIEQTSRLNNGEQTTEFLIRVSYLEVYNEEIQDLLQQPINGKSHSLRILKDDPIKGAIVEGLVEEIVVSREQVLEVIAFGESNRSYGATNVHSGSSRSHTIFRMVIESKITKFDSTDGSTSSASAGPTENSEVRVSYLNLVDLAGSERQESAGTSGERLREGGFINKSLSALSLVISKLVEQTKRERGRERNSARMALDSSIFEDGEASFVNDNEDMHVRSQSGTRPPRISRAGSLSSSSITSDFAGSSTPRPFTPSRAPATPSNRSHSAGSFGGVPNTPMTARKAMQKKSGVPSTPGGALNTSVSSATLPPQQEFIPYRNSKLTRLLRQSIGGNAYTSILCTMSPSILSREESISTLKFGQQCKSIQNKVSVNITLDDKTLLKQYRLKISELKTYIEAAEQLQMTAQVQANAALALLAVHSQPDANAVIAASRSTDALQALSPLVHKAAASVALSTPRLSSGHSDFTNSIDNQLNSSQIGARFAPFSGFQLDSLPKPSINGGNNLSSFGWGPVSAGAGTDVPSGEASTNPEIRAAKLRQIQLEKTVERLQSLIIGGNFKMSPTSASSREGLVGAVAPLASPAPMARRQRRNSISLMEVYSSRDPSRPPARKRVVKRSSESAADDTHSLLDSDLSSDEEESVERGNGTASEDEGDSVIAVPLKSNNIFHRLVPPEQKFSKLLDRADQILAGQARTSPHQDLKEKKRVAPPLRPLRPSDFFTPPGDSLNSPLKSPLKFPAGAAPVTPLAINADQVMHTLRAVRRRFKEGDTPSQDRMSSQERIPEVELDRNRKSEADLEKQRKLEQELERAKEELEKMRRARELELAQLRDRQAAAVLDAIAATKRAREQEVQELQRALQHALDRVKGSENLEEEMARAKRDADAARSDLARDVSEASEAVASAQAAQRQAETRAAVLEGVASSANQRAAEAESRARESESRVAALEGQKEQLDAKAQELAGRESLLRDREEAVESMMKALEAAQQTLQKTEQETSSRIAAVLDSLSQREKALEESERALELADARLMLRSEAFEERLIEEERLRAEAAAASKVQALFRRCVLQSVAKRMNHAQQALKSAKELADETESTKSNLEAMSEELAEEKLALLSSRSALEEDRAALQALQASLEREKDIVDEQRRGAEIYSSKLEEKETRLVSWESSLQTQESVLQTRESSLQAREAACASLEQDLAQRGERFQEEKGSFESVVEAMRSESERLAERERLVQQDEQLLAERSLALERAEFELRERQDTAESTLAMAAESLRKQTQLEANLAERKSVLEEMCASLDAREQALAAQERAQQQAAADHARRLENFEQERRSFIDDSDARVKLLMDRSLELDSRQQALLEREQESATQAQLHAQEVEHSARMAERLAVEAAAVEDGKLKLVAAELQLREREAELEAGQRALQASLASAEAENVAFRRQQLDEIKEMRDSAIAEADRHFAEKRAALERAERVLLEREQELESRAREAELALAAAEGSAVEKIEQLKRRANEELEALRQGLEAEVRQREAARLLEIDNERAALLSSLSSKELSIVEAFERKEQQLLEEVKSREDRLAALEAEFTATIDQRRRTTEDEIATMQENFLTEVETRRSEVEQALQEKKKEAEADVARELAEVMARAEALEQREAELVKLEAEGRAALEEQLEQQLQKQRVMLEVERAALAAARSALEQERAASEQELRALREEAEQTSHSIVSAAEQRAREFSEAQKAKLQKELEAQKAEAAAHAARVTADAEALTAATEALVVQQKEIALAELSSLKEQAQRQAQEIVEEASRKSEEVLENASKKADELIKAAELEVARARNCAIENSKSESEILLLSSRNEADAILLKAQEEAEAIRSKAAVEAEQRRLALEEEATRSVSSERTLLLEQAKESAEQLKQQMLEQANAEIERKFRENEDFMSQKLAEAESRRDEILASVESTRISLTSELETRQASLSASLAQLEATLAAKTSELESLERVISGKTEQDEEILRKHTESQRKSEEILAAAEAQAASVREAAAAEQQLLNSLRAEMSALAAEKAEILATTASSQQQLAETEKKLQGMQEELQKQQKRLESEREAALAAASQEAERIMQRARADADEARSLSSTIVDAAKQQADSLLSSSQSAAAAIMEDAKAAADRVLSRAEKEKEAIVDGARRAAAIIRNVSSSDEGGAHLQIDVEGEISRQVATRLRVREEGYVFELESVKKRLQILQEENEHLKKLSENFTSSSSSTPVPSSQDAQQLNGLRNKLEEMQAENAQLRKLNEAASSTSHQDSQELIELRNKVQEMQKVAAVINSDGPSSSAAAAAVPGTSSSLVMTELSQELEKKSRSLADARRELAEQRQAIADMEKSMQVLQGQLAAKNDEISVAEKLQAALRAEMRALGAESAPQLDAIAKIRDLLVESSASSKEKEEILSSQLKEVSARSAELEAKELALQSREQLLAQKEQDAVRRIEEMKEKERLFEETKNSSLSFSSNISASLSELSAQKEAVNAALTALEAKKAALSKNKKKLEAAARMVISSDSALSERETVVSLKEALLQTRQSELDQREKQIQTIVQRLKSAKLAMQVPPTIGSSSNSVISSVSRAAPPASSAGFNDAIISSLVTDVTSKASTLALAMYSLQSSGIISHAQLQAALADAQAASSDPSNKSVFASASASTNGAIPEGHEPTGESLSRKASVASLHSLSSAARARSHSPTSKSEVMRTLLSQPPAAQQPPVNPQGSLTSKSFYSQNGSLPTNPVNGRPLILPRSAIAANASVSELNRTQDVSFAENSEVMDSLENIIMGSGGNYRSRSASVASESNASVLSLNTLASSRAFLNNSSTFKSPSKLSVVPIFSIDPSRADPTIDSLESPNNGRLFTVDSVDSMAENIHTERVPPVENDATIHPSETAQSSSSVSSSIERYHNFSNNSSSSTAALFERFAHLRNSLPK